MSMKFCIEPAVFNVIPNLRVLVVTAREMKKTDNAAQHIQEIVKDYWKQGADACAEYDNVQSHPHVKAWRECYQAIGAVPAKKFASSVESLLKRASKQQVPRSINSIVDLYNAVSVRYIVPFGAFDINELPKDVPLELRFTTTADTFMALDETQPSPMPEKKEVAYVCGNEVVTRHVNWKQSKLGLVQEESKDVIFMAEILKNVEQNVLDAMVADLVEKLKELYQCQPEVKIMDEQLPNIVY